MPVQDLLYDWQVWSYFAILGWALRAQLKRTTPRQASIAAAIVAITWYYILWYTTAYKAGGGDNLFDDAYADVLRAPHDRNSCQLLTWVVVATVWARHEPAELLWTGMLGAMSAAFALTPPAMPQRSQRVPLAYVICSILSLVAIQRLPELATTDSLQFGLVLKALHVLLVAPRWLLSFGRSFDEAGVFAVLGVLVALRGDRVACWPETDCQRSIVFDLVACAAISGDAVRRDRGLTTAAIFCVASLAFSPGTAFAFYLALRAAAVRDAYEAPSLTKPLGRVLVVGAGASGLTAAKTLIENGAEVLIVEKTGNIGGVFADAYEDARQVSSKYITPYSDLRLGPDAESHQSLDDYVDYLQAYADRYDLKRYVRTATVVDVSKTRRGYRATIRDGRGTTIEAFDRVAVCSGLHQAPKIPAIPGPFTGRVLHSQDYKEPSLFKDQRVVVVGCGETAFDVAHAAAATGAAHVTLSTRRGFVSVPASFGEDFAPLDCLIANCGTHCWESSWSRRVGFHWWLTTKFQRLGMLFVSGSSCGFNQWEGAADAMDWVEGRKHIVNKATKCMPLLNRRAKAAWWARPWRWLDAAQADVARGVDLLDHYEASSFGARSVRFRSTRAGADVEVDADVVVLATGYRQTFPFLQRATDGEDDVLPSEHFICDPEEPDLAFFGFARPNVGAIPPMAELQTIWWVAKLRGVATGPRVPAAPYRLTGCRLSYGVDYGLYMFSLAREIGAAPNLARWMLERPAVALACAFGQAHAPLFRLDGPFAHVDAPGICANELLEPIKMRGFALNVIFGFNLLFFAIVNACAVVVEGAVESLFVRRASFFETIQYTMFGPLLTTNARE